jgi:AcrR family transcriptional regulator
LETNGFEGFNTNAVAEKAGVSIGSLYQYFPSKHALLSAIIEREVAPMLGVREELVNIKECETALRCFGPKGGPYGPYELVHAVESETEDGKAFLEILEHSVRREGLERVTARLKGDLR